MTNELSILIVDDNGELAELVSDYISRAEDVIVAGIANDGLQAIDMIMKLEPDIVLLDLVMPELDGIGVLERLSKTRLNKKPTFLVLSAISQDALVHQAMHLGAEYYIVKPFNLELLLSRIRLIHSNKDMPIISSKNSGCISASVEQDPLTETELEVSNILHGIGVPPHMTGYHYIKEALLHMLRNEREFMQITKIIYPEVAKKYKTTPERVERSIRNAIENTWLKGNQKFIEGIFGATVSCSRGKPTNSEFIAMIADKVKLNIKKKIRN